MFEFVDGDDRRAFRANHSMRFEHAKDADPELVDRLAKFVFGQCAGDLRNVIALLLFLNRTSAERVERDVESRPAMVRRKPSTLLKHTVISLRLNPIPKIRAAFGVGSAWRREHDVRGHFCHDERARTSWCVTGTSTHDWSEQARSQSRQWRCLKCGGLRWWKDDFKRGRKDVGEVVSSYEVHK